MGHLGDDPEAVSTLDSDFYKYGTWKHMRARTQLHHSDRARWLRRLWRQR